MTSDRHPMTITGKARLEAELKHLLQVERPEVVRAIEEARGHGDLSENADYDAAKERQAFCESRINDLQAKLAAADVVDPSKLKSDKIIFGATVTLEDQESGGTVTSQIVGEDEADVKAGKISIFSSLSRAMIGKSKGDLIEFSSPKGDKEYEVLNFVFK